MGAALVGVDDEKGNCDGAVDLFALGPKVELAGFVSAIAPGEAPPVGVALGSAGGAKPPKQLSKLFEPGGLGTAKYRRSGWFGAKKESRG